ncbi:hypothetical protein A0H81_13391 [Grifola frondosa]|uniref:Protein BIG1 n=1 Tax=Grifola frondosa TaxID=5627 RepID=A0A1C7LPJ6_GRIFR|nr:hypothetical protein A0H81_13391 [Grifola frondosa]
MTRRAVNILLALLPAATFAFSHTSPIVAWSSHSSNALSSASHTKFAHTTAPALAELLLHSNDICEHDAVVLIDHAGLHASDLRTLSPSCALAQSISSAPASLQIPYIPNAAANPFLDLSGPLARRCRARGIRYSPTDAPVDFSDVHGKHVVVIEMPALEDGEVGASRRSSMAAHVSWLSSELSKIADAFPNHLVIYSGSAPLLAARQEAPSSTFDAALAPDDSSMPTGGILKRYQLLTPGLIFALLLTLFVLLPIIFVGVSALASIQSPLTNEIPKGFSADEKKMQ